MDKEMNEFENTEGFDGSDANISIFTDWKVILPLIKEIETKEALKICIISILKTISIQDLPDVFHSLYFSDYLFHCDRKIQANCHYFLEELCFHFRNELLPTLQLTQSDGDLIKFKDFDISKVIREREENMLFRSTKLKSKNESDAKEVYKKVWFQKQKIRLEKIFKSSSNPEVALAMNYVQATELVLEEDIKHGKVQSQEKETENQINCSLMNLSELTEETWFARLFRYLIVNLLNSEWEIRCSCSLAISSILVGFTKLSSELNSFSLQSTTTDQINTQKQEINLQQLQIPLFLIEDILCIGLTVLVLDQFVDFENELDESLLFANLDFPSIRQIIHSTNLWNFYQSELIDFHFFPVKENIVQMLMKSFSLYLHQNSSLSVQIKPSTIDENMNNHGELERFFQILLEIISLPLHQLEDSSTSVILEDWPILISGLMSLNHFLLHFPEILFMKEEINQMESSSLSRGITNFPMEKKESKIEIILKFIQMTFFHRLIRSNYEEVFSYSFLLLNTLFVVLEKETKQQGNSFIHLSHQSFIDFIKMCLHFYDSQLPRSELENNSLLNRIELLFFMKLHFLFNFLFEIMAITSTTTELTPSCLLLVKELIELKTIYLKVLQQLIVRNCEVVQIFSLHSVEELAINDHEFIVFMKLQNHYHQEKRNQISFQIAEEELTTQRIISYFQELFRFFILLLIKYDNLQYQSLENAADYSKTCLFHPLWKRIFSCFPFHEEVAATSPVGQIANPKLSTILKDMQSNKFQRNESSKSIGKEDEKTNLDNNNVKKLEENVKIAKFQDFLQENYEKITRNMLKIIQFLIEYLSFCEISDFSTYSSQRKQEISIEIWMELLLHLSVPPSTSQIGEEIMKTDENNFILARYSQSIAKKIFPDINSLWENSFRRLICKNAPTFSSPAQKEWISNLILRSLFQFPEVIPREFLILSMENQLKSKLQMSFDFQIEEIRRNYLNVSKNSIKAEGNPSDPSNPPPLKKRRFVLVSSSTPKTSEILAATDSSSSSINNSFNSDFLFLKLLSFLFNLKYFSATNLNEFEKLFDNLLSLPQITLAFPLIYHNSIKSLLFSTEWNSIESYLSVFHLLFQLFSLKLPYIGNIFPLDQTISRLRRFLIRGNGNIQDLFQIMNSLPQINLNHSMQSNRFFVSEILLVRIFPSQAEDQIALYEQHEKLGNIPAKRSNFFQFLKYFLNSIFLTISSGDFLDSQQQISQNQSKSHHYIASYQSFPWKKLLEEILLFLAEEEMNLNEELLIDFLKKIILIDQNYLKLNPSSSCSSSMPLTRQPSSLSLLQFLGKLLEKQIFLSTEQSPAAANNRLTEVKYSRIFSKLILCLSNEISLSGYEIWLSIGVRGFGHFHEMVRGHCIQGFRSLVPLAPLGLSRHPRMRKEKQEDGEEEEIPLIQQLLAQVKPAKLCDSSNELDLSIMKYLSQMIRPSSSTEQTRHHYVAEFPLRGYQWDGITWWTLLRRCGLSGILADEMGLGKTIQALYCAAITRIERFLSSYSSASSAGSMGTRKQQLLPMLIICPASLTFHWMDEINKFFLTSPSPGSSYSSSSTGQHQPQQLFFRPVLCDKEFFQTQNKHKNNNNNNIDTNDYNLFIVSYDLFRRESSFFLSIFWDCILLDEAHLIRNPNILITKLIFQLQSSCRLLLTGTPLQNYLEDLWSLMHFLLPNYLGNYSHFQKHYLLPIKKSIETIKFFQSNASTTTVNTSSNNQKEKEKELETSDTTKNIPMTKQEQRQQEKEKKKQEKEQEKKNLSQQLRLKKHSQISIKGMELLHYLHQQILPFILRRTKEEVLQDLPAKTIVNILCPLSALQKKMYEEVLQKYSQNDQILLETILPAPSNNPSSKLPPPPTAYINVGDDENDEEQRENQNLYEEIIQLPSTSSSSINRKKVNLFQFQLHSNQDKHDPPSNNKMEKKNPLQFLSYLQSICCHPLMVMSSSKHSKYYENLSNQLEISGKFLQLMNLLMEIDMLGPDDFIFSPSSPILSSHRTHRRRSHRSGRGSSQQDFPFENFLEFKNSISELSEGNRSFCKNPEEDKNDLDGDDGHNADDQAPEEEAECMRMEESDSDESLSSSSSSSEEEAEETRHDDTTHSKKKKEADKNNEDQQQRNAFSSSRSRKCLIFVKHQQSLALLEKLVFQKYFPRVKYDRLDGSVPPQKRFQIAKAFNRRKSTETMIGKKNPEMPLFPSIILEEKEKKTEVNRDEGEGKGEDEEDEDDDGPRILLMTTRSCGLGLNLSSADTVIFLEHDWNPYVDLQAMDRVHRIGQLNPVTIYRLLADAPIENRIISSQDLKTNIADEVIEGKSVHPPTQTNNEKSFGRKLWESLANQDKF